MEWQESALQPEAGLKARNPARMVSRGRDHKKQGFPIGTSRRASTAVLPWRTGNSHPAVALSLNLQVPQLVKWTMRLITMT